MTGSTCYGETVLCVGALFVLTLVTPAGCINVSGDASEYSAMLQVNHHYNENETLLGAGNEARVKPRYTKRKAAIAWLEAHNTFRCMHGVPMLKWNNNLAKHSKDWGIEAKAQMKHSTRQARDGKTLKKQYPKDKVIKSFSYAGENLCWGSPRPQGPAKCTKAWYDEIQFAPGNGKGPMVGPQTISGPLAVPRGKFPPEWFRGAPKVKNYGAVYEYWKGESSKTTEQYTQVIWKEATHVGCATYKGLDVCQYGSISGRPPAGNMGGRFKANVKPLKKKNKKCRGRKKNKPKSDLPKKQK